VKCVVVIRDLRDHEPMAWDFVINFAKRQRTCRWRSLPAARPARGASAELIQPAAAGRALGLRPQTFEVSRTERSRLEPIPVCPRFSRVPAKARFARLGIAHKKTARRRFFALLTAHPLQTANGQ
jgi:hypothetical protein